MIFHKNHNKLFINIQVSVLVKNFSFKQPVYFLSNRFISGVRQTAHRRGCLFNYQWEGFVLNIIKTVTVLIFILLPVTASAEAWQSINTLDKTDYEIITDDTTFTAQLKIIKSYKEAVHFYGVAEEQVILIKTENRITEGYLLWLKKTDLLQENMTSEEIRDVFIKTLSLISDMQIIDNRDSYLAYKEIYLRRITYLETGKKDERYNFTDFQPEPLKKELFHDKQLYDYYNNPESPESIDFFTESFFLEEVQERFSLYFYKPETAGSLERITFLIENKNISIIAHDRYYNFSEDRELYEFYENLFFVKY